MILRFRDGAARDAFMERLARERPGLAASVRASHSQPDVVTVRGEDAFAAVREAAGEDAETFDDVSFHPVTGAPEA